MRRYKYPSMQKQLSKCEKVFALCNEESIASGTIFSMPISTKFIHFLFKLIKNRWAWGIVPENMVECKNKLNQALRVSMTTLWAAATKHCHTEETVETNDTYHILAMKTRGIVGGRKSYGKKIHPAAKDNSLTSEAELPLKLPLQKSPDHQTQHPKVD